MSSTSYVRSYPFDAKLEESFDKNRRVLVVDNQNVWHQHGPYGCLTLFQEGFSFKSGPTAKYAFHPKDGAPSYSITSYGGDLEFMALRLAPLDLHEPIVALFAWAREVAPYSFPPSGS